MNYGVAPTLVVVPVAVLHVVSKTRVGETKILEDDILIVRIGSEGLLEQPAGSLFKRDVGTRILALHECSLVSPWRYCTWF